MSEICPNCHNELAAISEDKSLVCGNCKKTYPTIDNKISILLENPVDYLVETFLHYERSIRSMEEEKEQYIKLASTSPFRANIFYNLTDAITFHINNLKLLQKKILPFFSKEDLIRSIGMQASISYSIDFSYFKRDWCWLPEGEEELNKIKEYLEKIILDYAPDRKKAVVLGAGTGRIARDLCSVVEKVFAFDKSFHMVSNFHDLLEQDKVFYEIQKKGVFDSTHFVKRLRASINPPEEDSRAFLFEKEFSFSIADARKLPIPDHSVAIVVSVYFTDVLPLHEYLHEIKRILKPNGIFIHFGPLDYHLDNIADMLSASEVKAVLRKNGLEVLWEDQVISNHLENIDAMANKYYKNWVFCAKVNKSSGQEMFAIDYESVVSISNDIHFELKGVINNLQESVFEANILMPNGEMYEGASSILDILKHIDGTKEVKEIIDDLCQEYNTQYEDVKEDVLMTIQNLFDQNVLEINQ